MMQDMCEECFDSGYDKGRINGIREATETVRFELLKYVMNNDAIYVNDVTNILDEVKRVLCEESDTNESDSID